jgi:hypothetical protein
MLWLGLANVIYFSGIGGTRIFDFRTVTGDNFPMWQVVWHHATLGSSLLAPYGISSVDSGTKIVQTDEYRLAGHVAFTFLPVLCLAAFMLLLKWGFTGNVWEKKE